MSPLATNRDLYLAVNELVQANVESQPTLESYLRSLRQLALRFADEDSIELDAFFALSRDAFSIDPPQFDVAWGDDYVANTKETGFSGWIATITRQIVDLHEMAESGDLESEMRSFGIQSPRGSHWVNFDSCSFLECAMAGSIGGWEPGDDTGRVYVPGPVAVLDEDDQIVSMNPEDVPRPIYPLPNITWDLFRDILQAGQHYE